MRRCYAKINCRSIRINDIGRSHSDVTDVRVAYQGSGFGNNNNVRKSTEPGKGLFFYVANNLGNLTVRTRVCSIQKIAQKQRIEVSVNFSFGCSACVPQFLICALTKEKVVKVIALNAFF
jgi:hypothetical protein